MTLFEQQVLPLFEQHRAEWLAQARLIAFQLGSNGSVLTIDDVRQLCPPPVGCDPRVMGAVFQRKYWENLGYTKGYRAMSHARPIARFKLRELDKSTTNT